MTKSYQDYVKTGQMTAEQAASSDAVRAVAKATMAEIIADTARQGLPADPAAFGALDTIAVQFVAWYGPVAAGEVFRHYAEVCERQGATPEGGAA